MAEDNIIFVDGFYSNDIDPSTPDFILGKGSIHPAKLRKFLDDNEQFVDKAGYLHYTIKRSNAGSRYISLDLWKYKKDLESGLDNAGGYQKFKQAAGSIRKASELPVIQQNESIEPFGEDDAEPLPEEMIPRDAWEKEVPFE